MQGLYGNIGEQIPDISMFPEMVNDISSLDSVESAKLRALRAKNVFTCQRALRTYVLTCQRVLRGHVLTCKCASAPAVITCPRVNMLVLKPLFSVSLPLVLKLYTLLVRFKNLITVFPQ